MPENFGCERDCGEEAACMDITAVNDRHLYEGRVVVWNAGNSEGPDRAGERIVRLGTQGWLTVADGSHGTCRHHKRKKPHRP